MDLLTVEEETLEARTGHLRFNIPLLAERLIGATDWLAANEETANLCIGFFGASTGAAAALMAAAHRVEAIRAIVSRGGRPDLAAEHLVHVRAPTLLIVGGNDLAVIRMNEDAFTLLQSVKKLEIVPGASHLFEEPGTLEAVARLACDWFTTHVSPPAA
jgi:dienelactone hydrolase